MSQIRKIIKFKRSTTNIAPITLNAGELAYAEGSNKLFIGHDDSTSELVLDGSIVNVNKGELPSAINLKKTNANNSPTLSIKTSSSGSPYTLTLAENPTSETVLMIDTDGSIIYENPTTGAIAEVGDVIADGDILEDEEILMYNTDPAGDGTETSKWTTVPVTEVRDRMALSSDANVEYNDVKVTGILEVDGDRSLAGTPTITVRDRMVTMGIGNMRSINATMTDGKVSFFGTDISANSIFVDSEILEIPAGSYDIFSSARSYSGVITQYDSTLDGLSYTVNSFYGNNGDSPLTYTFEIDDPILADILIVGGASGQSPSGSMSAGGHGGGFSYYSRQQLPSGVYDVTVGNGGYQSVGIASSFINNDNVISFSASGAAQPANGDNGGSMGGATDGGNGVRTSGTNSNFVGNQGGAGGNHYAGDGGHGWSEGDIVPNNGPSVNKVLVENTSAEGYDYDTHITRADALVGVNYSGVNHPYSVQNGGTVTESTAVGSTIIVTGARFEIDGTQGSYSGGAAGSGGGGSQYNSNLGTTDYWYFNPGTNGIGSANSSNHRAGGGTSSGRGSSGLVQIRYITPGTSGGPEGTQSFNVVDSSDSIEGEFPLTISTSQFTDSAISGGGFVIPSTGESSQKKLRWVDGTGWELKGGDLRIDSEENSTGLYINTEKVIEVDIEKTIVLDSTDPVADNEIKLEDAKLLHNYDEDTHNVDASIQVGRIDSNYKLKNVSLTGDFDFGTFD